MAKAEKKGKSQDVLVIGAGIAGMQSALLLAEAGFQIHLLDSSPAIGGYFPLLDKTFPTNSCGVCFMSPLPPAYCPIYESELHEKIKLMTSSQVSGIEGEPGAFRVSVTRKPTFVDPQKCSNCGACVEVCPVEVPHEFGGGLEKRKAIYLPFPQAIPRSYVIDPAACTRCGECLKVCSPGAIDLDMAEQRHTLAAGAVILGLGFEPFRAQLKGEYGFGRYDNVLSSIQYERVLSFSSPSRGMPMRGSDGRIPKKVAFIQCVGSRDPSCGQTHCSSICCMYAIKQAMITKERNAEAEIALFYMDIRPMGKDYERYYEKAKAEYGIDFRRSAVSAVKQLQQTKNLLVTYVTEEGSFREEEFDLIVLSVGFSVGDEVKDLARKIGVDLNEAHYCRTEEFTPTQTSRPGVYIAGTFREPRDIPETVVEGASAAAQAAILLTGVGKKGVPAKTYPEEGALGEGPPRIGVFFLSQEHPLADVVSAEELINHIQGLRDVVFTEEIPCKSPSEGFDRIKRRIGEKELNRLVVAGSSLRALRREFGEMARGIGFNPHVIEYANIWEGCGLVHPQGSPETLQKAKVLMEVAIERARRLEPLKQGSSAIAKSGLVVGAGIAGLTASLNLARQGYDVTLVEREDELGGNARHTWYTLKGSNPQVFLRELMEGVEEDPKIQVFRKAEVKHLEGYGGNYRTVISVDGQEKSLEHGVIILATGGKEVKPHEYLYGEDSRVVTQRELEGLIHSEDERIKGLNKVVMIQCVGSRDEEHPYCSRICCGHAVKNALKLKELRSDMDLFILYRDVRTYGLYEHSYSQARDKGVIFIRHDLDRKPQVISRDGGLCVSVVDPTIGAEVEIPVDLVVLSTGVEPHDNRRLAEVTGTELNLDGFFMEANPKSAPLDFVDRGKFFCGLCHSPNFIEDSIAQAQAASMRAAVLLSRGGIEHTAHVAYVNHRLCCGCGLCISACPYGARVMNEEIWKAEVMEDVCRGCSSCVIVCRNTASQQRNFEKATVMAMVDAAVT
ncbi:MAG: FAD-dependent oxidoreductase [Thermodesulfobacteriota bacterium]